MTAAGERQVLVIWRPTWEPVTEDLKKGAVWDQWVQEEAASKAKDVPVLAKAAAAAEKAEKIDTSASEGAGSGEDDGCVADDGEDDGDKGDGDDKQIKAGWEKVNAYAAASTARHVKKFQSTGSAKLEVVTSKVAPKVTVTMTPVKRGRGRPPKNTGTTKK